MIGRFEKATDFYYRDASGAIKPVALPEGMSISKNRIWIGDYIFEDVHKDGVIYEQARTYIGNPEPDFTFGFGKSSSYKGFVLSINLTGSVGNDVVNWGRRELENPRGNKNILKSALDYAQLALIVPKGPDDYREVIDRVRKDYRSYLDTCWMRELSESGKVEINQEVLKTVNNN